MASEMKDNIIIPVAPLDGTETAVQNTKYSITITKYLPSKSRKFCRWMASKVRGKGIAVLVQLEPVVVMVREHDLGKLVFNMGAPLTIGLIVTSAGKSQTMLGHFVLAGLCSGCELIFAGILLRAAFPEPAKAMEHAGIALVMTSFNGLVASALPRQFAWVPALSASLCVLPLVVAALPHDCENTAPGAQ